MKVKSRAANLSAFTLFEILLVLFCCSLFLLLPVLSIQSWQRRIEVQQFLASFEKNILFTQEMAIVNGKNTHVILNEEMQKIFFNSTKEIDNSTKLVVPKSLKVSGSKQITFKQFTGNSGNLSKFVFYWQSGKQTVEYQFQMGSGRFVKKIIEL